MADIYKLFCPKGMECRHLDGNCQNNRLSNLEWGTKSDNEKDKFLHGIDSCGIRNGNVKLTDERCVKLDFYILLEPGQ